jgi:predicted transcriptional regulator
MKLSDEDSNMLGLSSREKRILSALTKPLSPVKISSETNIPRTTINYILKQLVKRKLVQMTKLGKRNQYTATQEIDIRSEKKSVHLKVSDQSEFYIHIGIEDVIRAFYRIAQSNKNERVRAIQPNKSWKLVHLKLTPDQLISFNHAIIENKIIVDAVVQDNAYTLYRDELKLKKIVRNDVAKSLMNRMADYTTVPYRWFDYNAEIWIYSQTVFFINWDKCIGIEITNSDIMNIIKDMYEFVKAGGNKLDHNKAMQELLN